MYNMPNVDAPIEKFEGSTIYKKSRELCFIDQQICSSMNKKFKYTIGQNTSTLIFEMIEQIAWAYRIQNLKEKITEIRKLQFKIEQIIIRYRILNDLGLVGKNRYVEQMNRLREISQQAAAWFMSTDKKLSQSELSNE